MQDSGSLAVFKVTARDQGHYKGPSGAFVTYCNISCFLRYLACHKVNLLSKILSADDDGNAKDQKNNQFLTFLYKSTSKCCHFDSGFRY